MGLVLAVLMFLAQATGVAILVGIGLVLLGRTRRAAVLWLLAIIIRRRLPLLPEFEALGDGVLPGERSRLSHAASKLRDGASLAAALTATPGLVSEDAVVLAHVGERSGRLGEALGAEAERLVRVRDGAVSPTTSPALALLYLVAVPLFIPVIVTGLMIFIVPKFKKIFDDFGTKLPELTESLIGLSDAFAKFWYIPAVLVVWGIIPAVILWFLMQAKGWNFGLPRRFMPGGRGRRASLILRALAIPAAAGRPLDDALEPLATVSADASDRRRFARLRERCLAGAGAWDSLALERIVPRRDADLLSAAERAGNLPWALNLIADRIDDARRRRFAAFLEIAQPMVVLLLGAFVAFICIGFFLPLVDLVNALS